MFWAGALREGGQTQAPRASLVSWLLPGLAPPGSDHRGSSFSISSGKGVWTLQGGKRHWPRVAETEGQMPREHRRDAQWTSEVGARQGLSLTQLSSAPSPPLQGCQWT